MKNIHILPTDNKPSRLACDFDKLILNSRLLSPILYKTQNIYITSDEEIKEDVDQWYLDKFLNKPRNSSGSQYAEKQDVIILTTDQDLIKDGVQAIDDEFLEWFVKNPSCEGVQVEWLGTYTYGIVGYKIIIPKEEPKQSTKDRILSETPESVKQKVRNAANALVNKKETLEEFAERLCPNKQVEYDMIIEGAKWQQERSYSEEEVVSFIHKFIKEHQPQLPYLIGGINMWFGQYKKK